MIFWYLYEEMKDFSKILTQYFSKFIHYQGFKEETEET